MTLPKRADGRGRRRESRPSSGAPTLTYWSCRRWNSAFPRRLVLSALSRSSALMKIGHLLLSGTASLDVAGVVANELAALIARASPRALPAAGLT